MKEQPTLQIDFSESDDAEILNFISMRKSNYNEENEEEKASEKIDESVKALQVYKDEVSENIHYYKYQWRRDNKRAFYKCVSSKCKGRAGADIDKKIEGISEIFSVKKLRVTLTVKIISILYDS